ncbi:MAG: DUF4870 domain-containing protein [Akkermansiaceae bacterium]|nr:DUF4870 domain-containing protein [Akkermansiaceae bacterium]
MSPDEPPPIPETPPALPVQAPPPQSTALAPGAVTATPDSTIAMLAHLLGLFTGFIGPLILWLVKKDESAFVNHHGKEALNFQLFYLIVSLSLLALTLVSFGFAFIITAPLLMVMVILFLVWEIQACVAASRGEWYRYPLSLRFIA